MKRRFSLILCAFAILAAISVSTLTVAAEPLPLITDLVVYDKENAADWSIQNNIQVGDWCYGDRNYTITYVADSLLGCDWVRTANDSKYFVGAVLAKFRITAEADVCIAYNLSLKPPAWLDGWTVTTWKMANADGEQYYFITKTYRANSEITLGANGLDVALYNVVVKKISK